MRTRFKVLSSALKGLEFETDKGTVVVGRSSKNVLVLKQPSVSRVHARISVGDGKATVEDSGSRNQTRVDGQEVQGPVEIRDGSVVLFGEVAVGVIFPDLASAADENGEETPPAGAVVHAGEQPGKGQQAAEPAGAMAQSWLAGAQADALSPVARREDLLERRVWPALTLILGLAAAAVLTVLFLARAGLETPRQELGVVLRVGEDKVVEVPWGFVHDPQVDDRAVADLKRPLNLELAVQVTGRSQGLTTARLWNPQGDEHILLHVKVLPRGRQEAEQELADQVRGNEERLRLARQEMMRGDVLREQGAVYEALQRYGRALALLEPFARNPNWEYDQARQRHEEAERELQKRYDRLTLEMSGFVKDGDKRMALQRLAEIRDLIPEESDVRRQNADLLLRLLEKMIDRESRRGRRRL